MPRHHQSQPYLSQSFWLITLVINIVSTILRELTFFYYRFFFYLQLGYSLFYKPIIFHTKWKKTPPPTRSTSPTLTCVWRREQKAVREITPSVAVPVVQRKARRKKWAVPRWMGNVFLLRAIRLLFQFHSCICTSEQKQQQQQNQQRDVISRIRRFVYPQGDVCHLITFKWCTTVGRNPCGRMQSEERRKTRKEWIHFNFKITTGCVLFFTIKTSMICVSQ